jgi:outer membrane protein OmpA-like peptidoglycan-associated protein
MRSFPYSLCLAACIAFASPALADPAYRADDIINAFQKKAASPELGQSRGLGQNGLGQNGLGQNDLGQSRGLCIGTDSDCRRGPAGTPARAAAASFDLLVGFDLDSDKLTQEARRNLDEFARALADPRIAGLTFEVEGHTDGRGSEAHNLDLSRRRAEAVVQYLASRGVDPSRVLPRAMGTSRPRVSDPMDPANRRVETRLSN